PVNIQTACLIMEGAEFTENIINGVERPVKAAELFAFTLRVRAGNTDVLTDAEENTNNLFNNLIQRNQSAAFSSGKVRPNHETNINIIARRTGKDVNSHTVLDGIITTIMATIQR